MNWRRRAPVVRLVVCTMLGEDGSFVHVRCTGLCLPCLCPPHPTLSPTPTSTSHAHRLQMVTALPDIRKETLQPGDEFLILACDGIWDVLTNQEVRLTGWWLAWGRRMPLPVVRPEVAACAGFAQIGRTHV